jgi:glycosyltransferase involved in cell wall biosynthesis
MRISVIVPVYNVRSYLEEAVDSVLGQTYTRLEVILVDDGSTDGSGELCEEYARRDSRVRVIHQENRGLSAARNAGLDAMEGDLVAFLDSDDAYCPDMLLHMAEAMEKHGADIVECDIAVYDCDGRMGGGKGRPGKSASAPEGVYSKVEALGMQKRGAIASYAWNKLYRRRIWRTLRYREGQNYEDLDIILPLLAEADRIFCLDEALVRHRVRKGSITSSLSYANTRDLMLAHRHYLDFIRAHIPEYFDAGELQVQALSWDNLLLTKHFLCALDRTPDRDRSLALIGEELRELEETLPAAVCGRWLRALRWIYRHFPPAVNGRIYRAYAALKFRLGLR